MNVKVEIKCTNKDGSVITDVVELPGAWRNDPGEFLNWAHDYAQVFKFESVKFSRVIENQARKRKKPLTIKDLRVIVSYILENERMCATAQRVLRA